MFSMMGSKKQKEQQKDITPMVQEQLLADPRVQASIRQAGNDALNDPEVQRQIMETCKDKFPEYATAAKDQVKNWAKDPAVQAKAKEIGKAALGFVAGAGDMVLKQIEQGPAGVRALAFTAGVCSAVNAAMSMINIFKIFGHVVLYAVNLFQLVFACSTILFEAGPETLVSVQEKTTIPISKYQDTLMEYCKFLTFVGPRGMFYLFQGTLWLVISGLGEWINIIVGVFLIFVGTINILMHFGVAPKDVATKIRDGYQKVAGDGQPAEGA